MPAWIRNVPRNKDNLLDWPTEIPRLALRGGCYTDAEYHLEDGNILKISMEEMRRALESIPTRSDLKVGPFCIDPDKKCINGISVLMKIFRRKAGR